MLCLAWLAYLSKLQVRLVLAKTKISFFDFKESFSRDVSCLSNAHTPSCHGLPPPLSSAAPMPVGQSYPLRRTRKQITSFIRFFWCLFDRIDKLAMMLLG